MSRGESRARLGGFRPSAHNGQLCLVLGALVVGAGLCCSRAIALAGEAADPASPSLSDTAKEADAAAAPSITASAAMVATTAPVTTETANAPPSPASPTTGPAAVASGRTPWVHQHGLGIGYQTLLMRTESADFYDLHGPTVVYDFFTGRRWGLLVRASAHFPIAGQMHGPSGEFSGLLVGIYDAHRYGVDALLMVARRIPLSPRLVVTAAFGPHLQWFSLVGASYSPVED